MSLLLLIYGLKIALSDSTNIDLVLLFEYAVKRKLIDLPLCAGVKGT